MCRCVEIRPTCVTRVCGGSRQREGRLLGSLKGAAAALCPCFYPYSCPSPVKACIGRAKTPDQPHILQPFSGQASNPAGRRRTMQTAPITLYGTRSPSAPRLPSLSQSARGGALEPPPLWKD